MLVLGVAPDRDNHDIRSLSIKHIRPRQSEVIADHPATRTTSACFCPLLNLIDAPMLLPRDRNLPSRQTPLRT